MRLFVRLTLGVALVWAFVSAGQAMDSGFAYRTGRLLHAVLPLPT
jgi:hypothetical protein